MATEANNPQAKPPSTFAIFTTRMKHQGREKEFRDKLKEIQATTGKRHAQAMWDLLKNYPEFGYTTPKAEQAWYDTHRAELLMDEKRAKKAAATRRSRAKKADEEQAAVEKSQEQQFVEAVRDLPATAPYEKEFDWIRSHPAIMRLAASDNLAKKIKLTVDDVINAPNGPAPSQAAVYQLANAANAPAKMVQAVFAKMQKAIAEGGGGKNLGGDNSPGEWDGCDDEAIADTEALLKRLREQTDSASS